MSICQQKKIGKNNPKAEQIRKNNQVRMKWNSTVDEALFYQVPKKHIRTIKEENILKNVNKFGKTETKTVGGLRKNKSSRESAGVGIFAGVFEKTVEMACDCLKGLIRILEVQLHQSHHNRLKSISSMQKWLMNYWKIIGH